MKKIAQLTGLLLLLTVAFQCSRFRDDESDGSVDVQDVDADSEADVSADPDAADMPSDDGLDADAPVDGTDAEVPADGVDVDPDASRCLRGDRSGGQGDACTCADDCSEDTPLCMLTVEGDRYCAADRGA